MNHCKLSIINVSNRTADSPAKH
uniref:Uncharacterized protein n=1 Tax=Anguilla anguilla TaxID=7936 RepID=A0A0E9T0F4_ANGAN